jgi:hypothetical protein
MTPPRRPTPTDTDTYTGTSTRTGTVTLTLEGRCPWYVDPFCLGTDALMGEETRKEEGGTLALLFPFMSFSRMMIGEEKSAHERGYAGLKKKKGGEHGAPRPLLGLYPSFSFIKVEWKG